ncbi:polyhydroxyalkanoic acid system family protein [Sphingomonas sp. SM33]|uniref:Polyhydroxyalkanoic acid system family protein n=1 Tax=Sphingomonas telluris TaxID=2907998 RepID=A0ABS9VQ31_9SPHN|nr:polyhydroxyalkanoic acid system family protein [Sphingomonas telluris]MCH8617101.1 polyhydroxyalkanoic acid system family protein [Sphingomonas telluris]
MILLQRGLQSAECHPIVASMERPIEVDLPHKLGREEARRRIADNVHKLRDHLPGGAASHVQSNWTGDTLNLDISAMGQTVAGQIDVQDSKVRVKVMLPGMLSLFAAPIEAALKAKGGNVLLEDKSKKS